MCADSIRCGRYSGSLWFIIYEITHEILLQSDFSVVDIYSWLLWLMVVGRWKVELIINSRWKKISLLNSNWKKAEIRTMTNINVLPCVWFVNNLCIQDTTYKHSPFIYFINTYIFFIQSDLDISFSQKDKLIPLLLCGSYLTNYIM